MNHFIKQNWLKVGVLLFFGIGAFSAAWYYISFRPGEDRTAIQQQTVTQAQVQQDQAAQDQQAAAKEQQLENCVNAAHDDYMSQGQADCLAAGYTQAQINAKECLLPHDESQALLQTQNNAETLCATLYK